jgi:uncharacterized protein (DUF58 family)
VIAQLWQELWVLLFVVLILIGVFAGQGFVIAFGAMGLVITGLSWLWSRIALQRVTYVRDLPRQRAFIGDEVTMSVTLTNRKPIPLPLVKVEDELPDALQVVDLEAFLSPGSHTWTLRHRTALAWYERVRWDYRLRCTKRGYFRIGPAQLDSGDLFGFFDSHAESAQQDFVLVYPRVVPLPEVDIPSARPIGDIMGGLAIFQELARPMGVRDYQRCDPLKSIDWKATARQQRLQARIYEPSSSITVVLAVAVDTTPHHWEGYSSDLLERIVTASASVAAHSLERRFSVGLFSNGASSLADRPLRIPPSRDPAQFHLLLEALATVRPIVLGPMARQLAEAARSFPIGATVVLVAVLLPPDLLDTLRQVRTRGHDVLVLYVGSEKCPALPPGIVLRDISTFMAQFDSTPEAGIPKGKAA